MSNGCQITQKEQDRVVRPRLECIDAQELLDVWLLPLVKEVGGILEKAYRTSHQLFESGQFQREPILGQLEHALITAISELEAVKGWTRQSCCNMSSDKECKVLKGEEDTSEKEVLKEGSVADQFVTTNGEEDTSEGKVKEG